jgi:hypothetical protein
VTEPLEVKASDAEGFKTSAVAVALMLFPVIPQMREKNVGRLVRVIFTVTMGFTGKAPPTVAQFPDEVPFDEDE